MSSQLIDGVVIPYPDGRREHNTRFWRDATDLELEQAARIEELEKREWVDLTNEEIENTWQHQMALYIEEVDSEYWGVCDSVFARAIEAKLKEKNT